MNESKKISHWKENILPNQANKAVKRRTKPNHAPLHHMGNRREKMRGNQEIKPNKGTYDINESAILYNERAYCKNICNKLVQSTNVMSKDKRREG